MDERGRRYPRHDVVVIPRSEVLFLQSGAVIHLGIEVLGGELVEYPSTVDGRQALSVVTLIGRWHVYEQGGLTAGNGTVQQELSVRHVKPMHLHDSQALTTRVRWLKGEYCVKF